MGLFSIIYVALHPRGYESIQIMYWAVPKGYCIFNVKSASPRVLSGLYEAQYPGGSKALDYTKLLK